MTWQPIEIARKGDCVILAWRNDVGTPVVGEGYWHDPYNSWVWCGDHQPVSASHWMPLPSSPV